MNRYFSGDKVSFAEAFPTIKELHMEVITSAGITKFDRKNTQTYSVEAPPPAHIPCPKGGCTGSGYDVQGFLMRMVARGIKEDKDVKMCNGQEKMGRGKYRSCIGNFSVTVKIEYHSTSTQAAPNDAATAPPSNSGATEGPSLGR